MIPKCPFITTIGANHDCMRTHCALWIEVKHKGEIVLAMCAIRAGGLQKAKTIEKDNLYERHNHLLCDWPGVDLIW